MITVQGLTKRYARTLAVDHISFEVKKGQIVGFLGPNGAGKTTTMRILTCFLPPSEGTAKVAGFDVLEQPMEVKKRIGYLPETPPVYQEMEVQEYLTFVGKLKGMSGQSLANRVTEVAERCAVADVRAKLIGKLSKGYRQRKDANMIRTLTKIAALLSLAAGVLLSASAVRAGGGRARSRTSFSSWPTISAGAT